MKIYFYSFFVLIFTNSIRSVVLNHNKKSKRGHQIQSNTLDKRNLFLTTKWTAKEKQWDQLMRIYQEMRKQMQAKIDEFHFDRHLDRENFQNLEEMNTIYMNLRNNIGSAKDLILDKMDLIYNNVIRPTNNFY